VVPIGFLRNDRILATVGENLIFWNVDTAKQLKSISTTDLKAISDDGEVIVENSAAVSGDRVAPTRSIWAPPDRLILEWFPKPSRTTTIVKWPSTPGRTTTIETGGDRSTPVVLSSDGRFLATSRGKLGVLWDTESGREVAVFEDESLTRPLGFSADGKRVLFGNGVGSVTIWEPARKSLRRMDPNFVWAKAAGFGPKENQLVAHYEGDLTCLWEAFDKSKGTCWRGLLNGVREIRPASNAGFYLAIKRMTAEGRNLNISQDAQKGGAAIVAFSSTGEKMVAGASDPEARHPASASTYSVPSFRLQTSYRAFLEPGGRWLLGKDARYVAIPDRKDSILFIDSSTGSEVRIHKESNEQLLAHTAGQGRLTVALASETGGVRVFRQGAIRDALKIPVFPGRFDRSVLTVVEMIGNVFPKNGLEGIVESSASPGHSETELSPDGHWFAVAHTHQLEVYDLNSGRRAFAVPIRRFWADSLAFSPNSRFLSFRVDTGTGQDTASVLDMRGDIRRMPMKQVAGIRKFVFAPSSERILSFGGDKESDSIFAPGGESLRLPTEAGGFLDFAEFSPDSKRILLGAVHRPKLIEVDSLSGMKIREISLPGGEHPAGMRYTRDGSKLLVVSKSGGIVIFNNLAVTPKPVLMISAGAKGWVATDFKGHWDASSGESVSGIHWAFADRTLAFDELKVRTREPRLVARVLQGEEFATEANSTPIPPRVEISLDQSRKELLLRVMDGGSGVGPVMLKLNSNTVSDDLRGAFFSMRTYLGRGETTLRVPLSVFDPFLQKLNQIQVVVYDASRAVRARSAEITYEAPGKEQGAPLPEFYGVFVGVSDDGSQAKPLRYPDIDALRTSEALCTAAKAFFGEQRAHCQTLNTSSDGLQRPTRAAILRALQWLRTAKPNDVVVIYFSGHGKSCSVGREARFYFVAQNAPGLSCSDPESLAKFTVASNELSELLGTQIKASKRVLFVDACEAGGAVGDLSTVRSISVDHLRALENLRDRHGLIVVLGSDAASFSFEDERIQSGLMTYALLEGIRGYALSGDLINALRLADYISWRVPELARRLNVQQQPIVFMPGATPFELGKISRYKSEIPLPLLAVPVTTVDVANSEGIDLPAIDLGRRVRTRLRSLSRPSPSQRGPQILFLGTQPGDSEWGVSVRVQYRVEARAVSLRVVAQQGSEIRSSTALVDETDVDAVADRVASVILDLVRRFPAD